MTRLGEANRASTANADGLSAEPTQTVAQALVLTACATLAHAALRRWAPRADEVLLPLATLVVGVGWVLAGHLERVDLMGELSATASWQHTGWVALATVAFSVSLAARWRAATVAVASGVALAGLVLWPIVGYGLNGAATSAAGPRPPDASLGALSLRVGDVAVLTFELTKIALVVALTGWLTADAGALARRVVGRRVRVAGHDVCDVATAVATLVVGVGAAVVLWFSRDLVAAVVVLVIGAAMLAASAQHNPKQTAQHRRAVLTFSGSLALWTAALAVVVAANPALRVELAAWLEALWRGVETEFAFALAQGGAVGVGLGLGSPLVGHDPSAALLNSFAEALGFAGVAVLVALVAVVALVALRAAARAHEPRWAATAAGTFGALVVQPVLVLASGVGLAPPTTLGIAGLGFGPTSLLAGAIGWALLCRATQTPAPPQDAA